MKRTNVEVFWTVDCPSGRMVLRKRSVWPGVLGSFSMLVLFLAVLTLLFFGWRGYFSGNGLTAFGKIAAFAVLATLTAGFLFFTFKIVEWFLFSALSEVTIDRKTGWWSFRYLLFSRSKRLRPEAVVVKEVAQVDVYGVVFGVVVALLVDH